MSIVDKVEEIVKEAEAALEALFGKEKAEVEQAAPEVEQAVQGAEKVVEGAVGEVAPTAEAEVTKVEEAVKDVADKV